MRHRRRSITRILAVVLLCAALLEGSRSFWFADGISYTWRTYSGFLLASHGRVNFTIQDFAPAMPAKIRLVSWRRSERRAHWERVDRPEERRRFLGFECSASIWTGDVNQPFWFEQPSYTLIAIPFWAIALLTLLPRATSFIPAARRRRRLRQQLCPECSYDLRATPDRCPECGWKSSEPGAEPPGSRTTTPALNAPPRAVL